MKDFKKAVLEIRSNLFYLILLESVTSGFLVFLIAYLILSFFDVSFWISFLIGCIGLAVFYFYNKKIYQVRKIEQAYPFLGEKLRTAVDTAGVNNEVVEDLQAQVLSEIKHVHPGMFFDSGIFSLKIVFVVFFSFLLVFTSFFHIQIKEFRTETLDSLQKNMQTVFSDQPTGGNISNLPDEAANGAGISPNKNILGKKSLTQLGDKTIDVTIRPAKYEFTVRESGDQNNKEFKSEFPNEIHTEQSTFYQENIPKDDQDVVKAYFKKLAEQ